MGIKPYNVDANEESQTYGFYDKSHVFSNCFLEPLEIEGTTYPSLEHAYQSIKFAESQGLLARIAAEPDPEKVAVMVQQQDFKRKVPEDWGGIKVQVMAMLLREKVNQSPRMRAFLLKSKDWEVLRFSSIT